VSKDKKALERQQSVTVPNY